VPPTRTEVVMLEARLLGIEETADEYLASVEFSGMVRGEEPPAGPSPFRAGLEHEHAGPNGRTGGLAGGGRSRALPDSVCRRPANMAALHPIQK